MKISHEKLTSTRSDSDNLEISEMSFDLLSLAWLYIQHINLRGLFNIEIRFFFYLIIIESMKFIWLGYRLGNYT